MKKHLFNLRSAYGQLVAIVFLPITFLAMVGGYLVFSEVRVAMRAQQDALAHNAILQSQIFLAKQAANGDTLPNFNDYFYKTIPNQVQRVILLDKNKNTVAIYGGQEGDVPLATELTAIISEYDNGFERQKTTHGLTYGRKMDLGSDVYYLMMEMDDDVFTITSYRVAMALAVTGLITLMLLLLILNIYSKRWITPIYEMRLYLQRLSAENLSAPIKATTDGEFTLLQRDFVQAMRRLDGAFTDLKNHAKETEADLQQAFDEMEMQNISIRQAHKREISTSQAKSAFLANISHELRTPLNSIDGFISLLARHDGLTSEQNLYVQTIKKSSAHLLALVNDVLDFSKIEAGKLILERHDFDLYAAVYDVVDMLSPVALEKHLRLAVLFYDDVPMSIMGDSLRIKQILTNLVGNAIKFTDSGGVVVKVSLAEQDDFLHFSVIDTGKGVSDSDKEQLFVSFSQGDLSVTRRYGGTGLGLVISKELTELMGGQIGFCDNASQHVAKVGATFWFEIPCEQMVADEMPKPIPLPCDRDLKLLVWINHAPAMQVLQASLAMTGASIHFAIGFADLLEQLDNPQHGYNVVIVDYFGQDAAQDDVGAILRQIRGRYQGKLITYGYQVGMDTAMLHECRTHALYEPLDKRQLYALLCDESVRTDERVTKFTGKRILAVDDHQPNLMVLEALLKEIDVQVVLASSGFDAIEEMSRSITGTTAPIDLIFMDIQMPRMSGLDATLQIRKIEQHYGAQSIPIIALTAHGLSDEKDRLVAAGMDDYVGKPIGLGQLIHTLTKWLDNGDRDDGGQIRDKDTPISTFVTSLPLVATKTPLKPDDVSSKHTSATIHGTQTMPDIDWADALARASGKADLAHTLLGMIVEAADSDKYELERAWADRDRSALADIAHRLVGASRYTGTPRLRDAAQVFEDKCRADTTNVSASQFVTMRPAYRRLIDALDSLGEVDLTRLDL